MSEPTLQYDYDPANSFEVDRPPLENGWYGVLFDDGLAAVAYWRDGAWQLDDTPAGKRIVRRYSGRSVRVDGVRWPVLVDLVRAAWPPVDHDDARQIAGEAALSLARHCAWQRERVIDAETEAVDVFQLCWFYRMALACGETLTDGTADAAIFHFYWEALDPAQRAEIDRLLLLPPDAWPTISIDV